MVYRVSSDDKECCSVLNHSVGPFCVCLCLHFMVFHSAYVGSDINQSHQPFYFSKLRPTLDFLCFYLLKYTRSYTIYGIKSFSFFEVFTKSHKARELAALWISSLC